MKLKLSPEDFKVDELVRWDEDPKGHHAIYRVEKRKLTTFEAVRLIAARCDVPLDKVSYVGLKDRQGVTTQYLSVEDALLKTRVPGVHTQLVGRSAKALSSENLLGNDFTVVVRDLSPEDARALVGTLAAVKKHGLPHYFDDQRFGSVAAGQGFPARLLVQGDPEGALKLLVATPGTRDPLSEKKWKFMLGKMWGQWDVLARKWANRPGASIVRHLRRKPTDFAGAWQCMPGKERAIHIFAYQSYIWNEAVATFLREILPPGKRLEVPYVAGRHVFWTQGPEEQLPPLPETFPLVDDATPIADERISRAVDAALKKEKLTRASFKIKGIAGSFFKHEERPLVLRPERLVVARPPGPDNRHPGRLACTIPFRLPPGGYATLVLKRLFPQSAASFGDERPSPRPRAAGDRDRAHAPRRDGPHAGGPRRDGPHRDGPHRDGPRPHADRAAPERPHGRPAPARGPAHPVSRAPGRPEGPRGPARPGGGPRGPARGPARPGGGPRGPARGPAQPPRPADGSRGRARGPARGPKRGPARPGGRGPKRP